jgi:hypothetical protein
MPERMRLFRLLKPHAAWTSHFLASHRVLGVADTYGIALIHPICGDLSPKYIGKEGKGQHR